MAAASLFLQKTAKMIQPNNDAIGFTNWMLNISKQHLSGPQRIIVEEVNAAALGSYPISEQTWYNFNLFTAWRNPYYLVYSSYATSVFPDLLTDLLYAWNFEGSSNSTFGVNNGIDTNIVYGPSYGKINEGAGFVTSSSNIIISPITQVPPCSFSLWARIDIPGAIGSTIWADAGVTNGFIYNSASGKIAYYFGAFYDTSVSFVIGAWAMLSFTYDGVLIRVYVNGILELTIPSAGSLPNLQVFSALYPTYTMQGAMDAPAYWYRLLSQDDITALYNGGAGIQYPF